MKHIQDYKRFLNESGFHGPTNRVTEKEYSDEERSKLAKSGEALPDGSFPITNVADLKNAIQAYGRAKNQAAAAKHIAKRAKALGAEDLIPTSEDFQKSLNEAKRTKFTGKTAHDLYIQLDGKPKWVFVKNDWYQVNPAELKDDNKDSFIGYTKDGSDYEFYLKDIKFIQESLNELKATDLKPNHKYTSDYGEVTFITLNPDKKTMKLHSKTTGYIKTSLENAYNMKLIESAIDEAKEYSFTFNYNTDDDDVEYIQDVLMNAGVDAIAEPGLDSEEMIVKALNAIELRKAKKAIKADGFDINEAASINKIQSDWTKTTNDMKKEVELWKASDEKDKEKHLKHLKDLTKKKRDLEDALNLAVELKDVDAELVEEKLNVDIVAKKWDELYGEDLKDDYYDIWKKLKAKGSFTLSDLEKMWDAAYGEMFKDEYDGLYKELMNESQSVSFAFSLPGGDVGTELAILKTKDGDGFVVSELNNRKESVFISWKQFEDLKKRLTK